jgi:hypothetical protein
MSYKSAADGVTQSGKTKGKNLGEDGKKVGIEGAKCKSGGGLNAAMKKVGRNMARANNQK